MLLVEGGVEVLWLPARWIQAHAVGPLAGGAGASSHPVTLSAFTAPVMALRLASSASPKPIDRLIGRVADQQVSQQPSDHRRKPYWPA